MTAPISVSVMMPALNEEENVRRAVTELLNVFRKTRYDWEVVLIDDGSTDGTGRIVDELAASEERIKAIHHDSPRGIGCSFLEGIRESRKEVFTWLPADGENDPRELLKYLPLMEHVDIVIPFVVNKNIRPTGRRILSAIYLRIINATFQTRFNYTNGNIIYRKKVFEKIKPRATGFLVHAECLVRSIHAGFIFAEVPVVLQERREGTSKALMAKTFINVMREYLAFVFSFYILRDKRGDRAQGRGR